MAPIDHVGISVTDYAKSLAFYEAALAPLGVRKMMEFDTEGGKVAGFGAERPDFWIGGGAPGHVHLAFSVGSRGEVEGFHAAALAAGGRDHGAPGIRAQYHPNYYAAFVLDPDGHNIEAVFHGTE
jgi:catechol 2,3-dioxygenase-like lactoylglutathione lyase family enzyme